MMNSLNIGTLILGSVLSQSSLPEIPSTTERGLSLPAIPLQGANQTNQLEPNHDQVERIKDIKAGLIKFSQLSADEKKNEKIILAALETRESALDVLTALSRADYDSPEIRRAVALSLGARYSPVLEPEPYWVPLFEHPLGRAEVFETVVKATVRSSFGDSEALLKLIEAHAPSEFQASLSEMVITQTREAYLDPALASEHHLVPELLRSDPEAIKVFVERLRESGDSVGYEYLSSLGLGEDVCLDLYRGMRNSGKTELSQLIYMAPDKLLMGEWRGDYLRELKSGNRAALGRLSETLVADAEISVTVRDLFSQRPDLLNALRKTFNHGLGEDAPFSQEIYRSIVADRRQLDRIVALIRGDLSLLNNFPEVILRQPRVAYGIRSFLNEQMASGGIKLPQEEAFFLLHGATMKIFPELINEASAERLVDAFSYRFNPRALVSRIQNGSEKTAPRNLVQTLLSIQEAAALIGVSEFGRFDNAYELFRNRYQVAAPEIQEELRQIMGEDYFADIKEDTRPLCVVVNPASYTDHNGAFLSRVNNAVTFDAIDLMTCYYHVLYFEASDETELTRDMIASLERISGSEDCDNTLPRMSVPILSEFIIRQDKAAGIQ